MILSKNISCKTAAFFIACFFLFMEGAISGRADAGPPEIPSSVRLVIEGAREKKSAADIAPGIEESALLKYSPVAVLPVLNLSREIAPLHKIRRLSMDMLRENGFEVLDEGVLDVFMEQHRIRYVGGIDRARSRAFSKDTGAGSVLVTYLEHYDEKYPPKIAMTYRLVSTGEKPAILWTDSAGLAGDDAPEILGLGLIKEPAVLIYNTVQRLSDSLLLYMVNPEGWKAGQQKRRKVLRHKPVSLLEADYTYNGEDESEQFYQEDERFWPKVYNRTSFVFDKGRQYTVAVLPFFNRSERKYAGEILQQHFIREMGKLNNLKIIETGVVRAALLKSRVVMYDGISLDHATVISSMLKADFIVTGTVLDYEDYKGPLGVPRVDFSVMLIERRSRQSVWTSKSFNEGDDSVFFFDLGKMNTAHAMASEMTGVVSEMMFDED